MEQQLKHRAWFESPATRLNRWREFRQTLDSSDSLAVCRTVLSWWESAPLVSITIDPVNPDQWPTPWEMLHQGDFCENSLALGMAYTIYYANISIPVDLMYITCRAEGFQKLCAWVDNKHLLNFTRGEISTFPGNQCSISYQISINSIIKKQQ